MSFQLMRVYLRVSCDAHSLEIVETDGTADPSNLRLAVAKLQEVPGVPALETQLHYP